MFESHLLACWGDGSRGQLGVALPRSLVPVKLGDGSFVGEAVAVGGAHTCVRIADDQLSCFGADDEGQLGGAVRDGGAYPTPSKEWSRGARIRAFALGQAHTCVAYEKTDASKEHVLCRGRSVAAGPPSREPMLGSVVVKELTAGGDHSCALIEDGSVRCWGKNDVGQLGDGTTNDADAPVSVVELSDVLQVAAGLRHTCALLRNGTVACWGENSRHQLSIGTTENSSRPRLVVGIVGAKEINAAGNGSCVRLDGGYVRCWGANDRGQLGDDSAVEHNVPSSIKFR